MDQHETIERAEAMLAAVNQHIFLVKLHISWPKMKRKIVDAIVEVNDEDGNTCELPRKFRNNPQWKLMPEEWKNRFTRIEGKARSCLNDASIAFASTGMATIAVKRADLVFQQLREYRDTMYAYRDEFVELYSDTLQNIRQDITNEMSQELADKAIAKLPTLARIRGTFDMNWAIVPIGNNGINRPQLEQLQAIKSKLYNLSNVLQSQEQRCEILDAISDLGDVIRDVHSTPREMSDGEASEFVTEARLRMANFANEFVQNISRGPRQQLETALGHLLKSIREQRNIKAGTITQVQQACQMVRDFDFMQDRELLDLVGTVETELTNVTPQQVNSDSVFASQLAEAVTPAVEACQSAERAVSNERQFSRLVLRKNRRFAKVG